ncbi:hypothetical protein SAMN05892883_1181 [Jatrophihabitans sp. GAS493]|uniref:hypothetical protein n=1 Tax=Jatrophihabitans sp. GAS493 TaxID=1907575 RepID=UPI000BBF96EA|nr:hypothetical protein [Jatrophihabitans sp. GAS493]SOD71699.1 hypothetical protein SAMN05892883_1181 [Jatrophihabitans sp. GAS493]
MMGTRAGGRALVVASLTSVALGTSLLFGAATASAVGDGTKQQVCSDTLYLRTTASQTGPAQGTLHKGDHVLVHSHAGNDMLYVFAYGQLNRNGYVRDGHFC